MSLWASCQWLWRDVRRQKSELGEEILRTSYLTCWVSDLDFVCRRQQSRTIHKWQDPEIETSLLSYDPSQIANKKHQRGKIWSYVGGCVCVCVCVCVVLDCKKRSVLHQESKRSSLEPKRKFLSCAKLQKEEVWVWNPKKNFCFVLSCKRRKSEFGTRSDLSSCDKSAKEETNCFFQIKAKERCCVLLLLLWTPKKLQTPFVLWTN